MLLTTLIRTSPLAAFIGLVLLGVIATACGASLGHRNSSDGPREDDGLIIDGVVAPVLGLFALMVAFTFGQALTLESATYADTVSARLATTGLISTISLVPGRSGEDLAAQAQEYSRQLHAAIQENRLESAEAKLSAQELAMRRSLLALGDSQGKEMVTESLGMVSSAVRQLLIDSAQRIPATVFGVQSLYYAVCFVILGYKASEHRIYPQARLFIGGLAVLFSVVMFMAMNIGRPGLNQMLFDRLPR